MKWQEMTNTELQALYQQRQLGILSDMDGTLSHIVDEPDQARISEANLQILQRLTRLLPLVGVVSGRAVADLESRLAIPGLALVGNHGFEYRLEGQHQPAPEASAYRPALQAALNAIEAQLVPGMRLEDKTLTLSVHYRQTRNPAETGAQLAPHIGSIAAEHGLDFFQGRMVFELRPPVEINKGTAVAHLVEQYHLDAVVYLGDDTTDIDALKQVRSLRQNGRCYGIGVGVQSPDMPDGVGAAADCLVAGVDDVAAFLTWLADAWSESWS